MPWSMRSARSKLRRSSRRRHRAKPLFGASEAREPGTTSSLLDSARLRYFGGAATTTLPVGTIASAVLVDFAGGGVVVVSAGTTALLTNRSCIGFGGRSAPGAAAESFRGRTPA